jgi:uncharacterized protein
VEGERTSAPPTSLLVLQGTPFCNLDCSYCYLPNRNDKRRMPLDVVGAAVEWIFRETRPADPLAIVWHAGEPLTLPIDWYEEAFAAVAAAAPPAARIRHHVQTNATLIDDRWCDFFQQHHVNVGVSIDGPADLHDAHRRTRRGSGSHDQVMRGVAVLQRRAVPFHVICVVHAATLDAPDRLADFFIREGITRVGINIEEIEGVNGASSLSVADIQARYERFLDRLLERAELHGNLHIREADGFVAKLTHPAFGRIEGNDENRPFAIVTVAHDGQISTYSPELADLDHPLHGPFRFGSVKDTSRSAIEADPRFQAIEREIAAGISMCAEQCRYHSFCAGGAPSNKLAENGSLASAETLYCRLSQKATIDVMLRRMTSRLGTARHESPQSVAVGG